MGSTSGMQVSQAVDGAKVVKIMRKKCYSSKETPKVFAWCEIDSKKILILKK